MQLLHKKQTSEEIIETLGQERALGKKIVLCLGVFDLVHPGHIRHLQEAKSFGDILVVAITANQYVNKGPDRPVFSQDLRIESVAAIECVDYVILNDHAGGVEMIDLVKPDYYVKGVEYKELSQDVTGKILDEKRAVERHNGELVYTNDIVFSSSKLLNTYFNEATKEFRNFIHNFKSSYNCNDVIHFVEQLKTLNVLVIGDAIIDEYVYVQPLGVAGKGTHLVARCQEKDQFLGGAFAVANHAADFAGSVTLLTAIGEEKDRPNLNHHLHKNIKKELVVLHDTTTLVKRRYVQRDGENLSKLFETYSSNDQLLNESQTQQIENYLDRHGNEFDLIIVCDFGNGFLNGALNKKISSLTPFLAINTQINSGNRGYHVVTKYSRADYISLNEPELRLTAHDLYSDLGEIILNVSKNMSSSSMSVTQGVKGATVYSEKEGFIQIPALTHKVVDRVGAGDSYLTLSALAFAKGSDINIAGFLGSAAAAMDVQIVGNKKSIEKIPLLKYITTLLK
jgi:rfaE bifunctional protein kinase chain/domain/rfaE bifunctional protein nucleotidyltransferase chain/domain